MSNTNLNRILNIRALYHKQPNRATLYKFISCEHLAHVVPYELNSATELPNTYAVIDEDGESREYKVTSLHTQHPGIVGYVLVGQTADNPRVHIVFRGTSDKASVQCDIDYGGAGNESFAAERHLILSQIVDLLGKRITAINAKIAVTISGHSLGGGYAKKCLAELLEYMELVHKKYNNFIARTTEPDPLAMIKSITLNHANSAGVSREVAATASEHAKFLARLGLEINVCALRVDGDKIQDTGQADIFSDVDPKVAIVEVLKIKTWHGSNLAFKYGIAAAGALLFSMPKKFSIPTIATLIAWRTYNSHTKHNFNQILADGDYEYFNNATPHSAKKVKRELESKTIFDNNPISESIKRVLSSASKGWINYREIMPEAVVPGFKSYMERRADITIPIAIEHLRSADISTMPGANRP